MPTLKGTVPILSILGFSILAQFYLLPESSSLAVRLMFASLTFCWLGSTLIYYYEYYTNTIAETAFMERLLVFARVAPVMCLSLYIVQAF